MLHLLHLRQHSQQDKTGVFFFACLSVFQSKDEPEGTGKGKKMMAPFWVDL